MMVPSNMLLSILKPRIYLPTVVIIWGAVSPNLWRVTARHLPLTFPQVSGSTGFSNSWAGLVAARFFTGATEAPYFPGCIFLLSSWYTKAELPSRIAIFYLGYTLASAFGGLLAAGIVSGMDGLGGYEAWVCYSTFLEHGSRRCRESIRCPANQRNRDGFSSSKAPSPSSLASLLTSSCQTTRTTQNGSATSSPPWPSTVLRANTTARLTRSMSRFSWG